MQTRKLGKSDLQITPIGDGAWAIGGSGWHFAWGSQDDNHQRFESLTPRERDVLPLVVSGLLNKQIAAQIGTSVAAGKVHRSQLMRKMGANPLPALVRMAEKLGISCTVL